MTQKTGGPGRGGRREGAGAKRYKLPDQVLERLGPPPADRPLKMARWWVQLVAECTWLYVQGQCTSKTLDKVRAVAASAAKILPDDIRAEADRLMRQEEEQRHVDQAGPGLERIDGASRSLRSDPT